MAFKIKKDGATIGGVGIGPAKVYRAGDVVPEDEIAESIAALVGNDPWTDELLERVDDSELTPEPLDEVEETEEESAEDETKESEEQTEEERAAHEAAADLPLVIDPVQHTVDEVLAKLVTATQDQVDAVKAAEAEDKDRAGIRDFELPKGDD